MRFASLVLRRVLRRPGGQGLVEYALVLALVATVAIVGLNLLGRQVCHVLVEVGLEVKAEPATLSAGLGIPTLAVVQVPSWSEPTVFTFTLIETFCALAAQPPSGP